MAGVKGMVPTGRLVEPPPSARKVPSFKLWAEPDGTLHGPYGPKKVRAAGAPTVNAVDATGREFHVSVAQMVARAWLPPRPPGSKLVHLDGDPLNNAASNLAWEPNLTSSERSGRSRAKVRSELAGSPMDPRHGTRSGYQAGCRCARCRAWKRLYACKLETRKAIREVERVCGKGTTP